MISICRYTPDKEAIWNAFVKESKNGTFLFLRSYMEYHSDRFADHSLLYYNEKGKLVALMAANESSALSADGKTQKTLASHQGLTYGGFVLPFRSHMSEMGELFDCTIAYLQENGFNEWIYKKIPSVYHQLPADEDEYWLWRNNAEITACHTMSAIALKSDRNTISSSKRNSYNKLLKSGYTINLQAGTNDFWPILEANLMEKFHAKPVHSLTEILLLKERFPQNILCCTVSNPKGKILAGTLLYLSNQVVRTQYTSASHEGKKCRAVDFLLMSIYKHFAQMPQYQYLDFGTSTGEDDIHLNDSLTLQKETLGGNAIACKTYRIRID